MFFISYLILAHLYLKQEIEVAIDAMGYRIGAVILHRFENGTTKPVAHVSRILLSAEKNYSYIEKEGLR